MDYPGFVHYTNQFQTINVLGDVYVQFSAKNTDEKRFKYTRLLLKKYGMLPTAVHPLHEFINETFDHALSNTIRSQGNENFKAKKYVKAIDNYSESMIISMPGTECYAYSLANRSAALFHYGEYQYCLDDIRRALRSKYPKRIVFKLYERAGNAERMLGRGDLAKKNYLKCLKYVDKSTSLSEKEKQDWKIKVTNAIENCKSLAEQNFVKKKIPVDHLMGGKNEKIPAFSKNLELKLSTDSRRGVYATCDINPGDVVAMDEAYIGGPFPDFTSICHYAGCLKMSITIIPCPKCSLAYYCNEECIQKAIQDGHNLECSILYSIRKIPGIKKMNELVLRWFVKECSKMGIEKYCSVVNSLAKPQIDPKTRGFDENDQFKSDNFSAAYSMNNDDNIPMDVLFFFNCIAVEILQYLMLSGFKIPENYIATAGASLVHMLNILDINCQRLDIYNSALTFKMLYWSTPIAYVLYPSICLFNYSCDPNVKRSGLLSDKTRVLKAIQYIPKGTELFISNGADFYSYDKKLREMHFTKLYKLKCTCQPCLENWPISRYVPDRISSKNLVNPKMADIVTQEIKKFLEFKEKVNQDDYHKHLHYLYSFNKFMFANVKRPFKLYEDCLTMISIAHILLSHHESSLFIQAMQEII